jgi:hypothetical protein
MFEIASRKVVRDNHIAPLLYETVNEVAADESGTACYQYG